MSSHVPSKLREAGPAGNHSGMRLRLYVTGATSLSLRAMANIQSICREYLQEHNPDLQIIDLYRSPASARAHQIFAAPTLIKELPLPCCRIIGDLSKKERVLHALGVESHPPLPSPG
ncbi:MAG TPA: circadian clock KaiB family protein [Nitrospirales bacterium]|nr:thiol-disulfide isomerase [Nitrospiraceae bacterium]HNP27939.1 circadian clock KaiB family protein [Nitrospirales bacterium]